ncbi:hypothetical protein VPH35_062937 [Triticum aestivum]
MATAARAAAPPLHCGLPDEILIWEILVRLPPKPLLRCRAVCRTWHHATSARDFLLAHHGYQPSLSIVSSFEHDGPRYHSNNILTFDHQAAGAQLQPVVRLHHSIGVEASCDGLLILSQHMAGSGTYSFSVCNPVTRQHASLQALSNFNILRMYQHRPTGKYRLLLHGPLAKGKIGCYVCALGSNQPPRFIGGPKIASALRFKTAALVRDSLHWYPVHHRSESKLVLVFDTTIEMFRRMHAPACSSCSHHHRDILEMDDTIGIYSYNFAMKTVDIWVLQNYESEVWNYKYLVELPAAQIGKRFGRWEDYWNVNVVSVDGDVFLLLNFGDWLLYVDTDGKLVDSFHRDGQHLYAWKHRLKQTLVSHTFFAALEGHAVNDLPFT